MEIIPKTEGTNFGSLWFFLLATQIVSHGLPDF